MAKLNFLKSSLRKKIHPTPNFSRRFITSHYKSYSIHRRKELAQPQSYITQQIQPWFSEVLSCDIQVCCFFTAISTDNHHSRRTGVGASHTPRSCSPPALRQLLACPTNPVCRNPTKMLQLSTVDSLFVKLFCGDYFY